MLKKTLLAAALLTSLVFPTVSKAADIRVSRLDDPTPSDSNYGSGCSLRQAILSHNAQRSVGGCQPISGSIGGVDRIVLASDNSYTISLAGSNEDAGNTGDIDITEGTLTIETEDPTKSATISVAPTFDDCLFKIRNGSGSQTRLVLNNIHFVGGVAPRVDVDKGGFALVRPGANLSVNRSSISGFHVTLDGAAVYVEDGGMFSATDSSFDSNQASQSGGAIYCNSAIVATGYCVLNRVTLSHNGAANAGGGIFVNGQASLTNTTLSGNSAATGGGLAHIVSYALACHDERDPGAAATTTVCSDIPSATPNMTLTHVTLAFNTARSTGGGIYNPASVTLSDGTTIKYPKVILKNSLISNNSINGNQQAAAADCSQTLDSIGGNLIQNMNGCTVMRYPPVTANNDATSQDPLLLPLADNGGYTQTHAFETKLEESGKLSNPQPVMGRGMSCNSDGAASDRDQRGVTYNAGTICDIGAFVNISPQNLSVGINEDSSPGAASRIFNVSVSNFGSFSADTNESFSAVLNPSLAMPTQVILDVILSSAGRTVSFDADSFRPASGHYVSARCNDFTSGNTLSPEDPSHYQCILQRFAVGDKIVLHANISNETIAGGEVRLFAAVHAESTRNLDTEIANNFVVQAIHSLSSSTRDFGYGCAGCVQSVTAGTRSANIQVGVNSFTGDHFTPDVQVSFVSAPASATGLATPDGLTFSPATISYGGAKQTVLSLAIPSNLPAGTYNYSVRLTAAGVTHDLPSTLTVQATPAVGGGSGTGPAAGATTPGFTLSATPTPVAITQGASGTVNVAITRTGGFTTPVGLALTGLPTGVTSTWDTTTTGDARILTLTVPAAIPAGSSTVTVSGLAETLSNNTTFILNVTGPISGAPGSGTAGSLGDGAASPAPPPSGGGGGCSLTETVAPGLPYSLFSLLGLVALRLRKRAGEVGSRDF
ncbi:MAG: hypothetical protein HQM15_05095 [Deltaproteobacteria bacterium]|nr:hypothetical protein [Deltaproteobacteria bacterium]